MRQCEECGDEIDDEEFDDNGGFCDECADWLDGEDDDYDEEEDY